MRRRLSTFVAVSLIVVAVPACRDNSTVELEPPATKVEIEGTDRYRVTLTPQAVERLDIQTADVTEAEGHLAITSDALILDTNGDFWVYVNVEPNTYERAALESVREVDGRALYAEGPAAGTPVVYVGVAELYGEETGVGK